MLSNLICALLQFDTLCLLLFLALVEETIACILSESLRGDSYYCQFQKLMPYLLRVQFVAESQYSFFTTLL